MPRPFNELYELTLSHLHHHDCGTYPFGDDEGLIRLVRKLAPIRVLELGTALGYTACCFASAAPGALIDTLEMDPDHVRMARTHIAQHGFENRVTVHQGKFEETLPRLEEFYDVVFFDGFAPDYAVLKRVRQHLRIGDTMICANLGLVDAAERNRIQSEIQNSTHWKTQPPLENGGTRVAVKCAA